MKKHFKSALISSLVALTLSGCVSTQVKQNSAYEFPLAVSEKSPAFIFPVSLHGVPGNNTEVGLAITAGATAKNGVSVISGQQLYSMVGNLSWTLGENMRRQVNKGEFKMQGYGDRIVDDLQTSMGKLTKALNKSGVVADGFNFKHIIVLHVDSSGGIPIPGVRRVTAFGGIIDIEKKEIISYIEKDLVLGNDNDAILAQMPLEMNSIIDTLIGKI